MSISNIFRFDDSADLKIEIETKFIFVNSKD